MSRIVVYILLLLVADLASAQGTQNIDMRKASAPLVPRMRVEVLLRDEGIDMQVKGSNGMMFGGGLIGELINAGVQSSRRKSAARAVADIRARIGDLPLGDWLVETLNQKLDRQAFAPEFDVVAIRFPKGEPFLRRDLAAQRRVLLLEPVFAFDPEAMQLRLDIAITIEDRVSLDGRTRARLQLNSRAAYAYTDAAVSAEEDRDARMALWEKRIVDREQVLRLLREAVDGAIDEINAVVVTRNDKPERKPEKALLGLYPMKLPATLLREESGRRWFRIGKNDVGVMYSEGALPAL